MKLNSTIATLVVLSVASLGQAETIFTQENNELPTSSNVTINQITLKLTQEQREDLLKVIEMMGAEVGDWENELE